MTTDRTSTEGNAMNRTDPGGPTLAGPDTPEHGMSVTHQAGRTETSTRRRRERIFVLACAAVTVAAMTGLVLLLTGDDDEPSTTPPLSSIEPTNGSSSSPPAPMTPEDVAAEEAKSRYLEYTRVEDLIGQSGYDNLELYDSVLIDPLNTQFKLAARRAPEGQRTTGDVEVVSLTVLAVQLPDDPRKYPEVRLQACLDVSGTDALDADGNSIVGPDRLDRIKSEALLQKVPQEAFASVGDDRPSGWYVAELVQRGEPC